MLKDSVDIPKYKLLSNNRSSAATTELEVSDE